MQGLWLSEDFPPSLLCTSPCGFLPNPAGPGSLDLPRLVLAAGAGGCSEPSLIWTILVSPHPFAEISWAFPTGHGLLLLAGGPAHSATPLSDFGGG